MSPAVGGMARTQREKAQALYETLNERFHSRARINFRFIDILKDQINEYPEINNLLNKIRLPLTVINGRPCFQGDLDEDVISAAIEKMVSE
jgi:hypothetical protein